MARELKSLRDNPSFSPLRESLTRRGAAYDRPAYGPLTPPPIPQRRLAAAFDEDGIPVQAQDQQRAPLVLSSLIMSAAADVSVTSTRIPFPDDPADFPLWARQITSALASVVNEASVYE